jgi:methyl-accepting chemotaxis protein
MATTQEIKQVIEDVSKFMTDGLAEGKDPVELINEANLALVELAQHI